jgi:RNA polymerase sigma-70 factor (ECF subfamily)
MEQYLASAALGLDAGALGELADPAGVYLACACLARNPAALALFERHLLAQVPGFVAHLRLLPAVVEDLRSELRERLLVGAGAPELARYSGRGTLGGWLRVLAVRAALNARRGQARSSAREQAGATAPSARHPELAYIRAAAQRQLREALEATVARLPALERATLREYYLEGKSAEAIAKAHEVHRATVARWIERARQRLVDETRRRLADDLRLDRDELESFLAVARSRCEVTFSRLFR